MDERKRDLATEQEMAAFGASLAALSRPGDAFLLKGTLGMGKTVLARGFVRYLTSMEEEVPSPTFTLLQPYEGRDFPVYHFDLYRLSRPEDVFELGFEEALADGAVLVEWPERLGVYTPQDALLVELTLHPSGKGRQVRLCFGSHWKKRLEEGLI